MTQTENRCNCCDNYCDNCGLKHYEVHYCDMCDNEMDEWYEYDGYEYCDNCLEELAANALKQMSREKLIQLITIAEQDEEMGLVPFSNNDTDDEIRELILCDVGIETILKISEVLL